MIVGAIPIRWVEVSPRHPRRSRDVEAALLDVLHLLALKVVDQTTANRSFMVTVR